MANVEEAFSRGFTKVDDYKVFSVQTDLRFEPGEKFAYSNLAYLLLGAVIEKISGQSYFDYITSRLFEPAGTTGADLKLSEQDKASADMAIGYEKVFENGAVVFRDNRSRTKNMASPAGGGYTTAEDLFHFAQAMRGHVLVAPETRDILLTPKSELNSPRYGFGFRVRSMENRKSVSHTGGYIGINNSFAMGLDDESAVIILSNLDILTWTVCEELGFIINQMMDRTFD